VVFSGHLGRQSNVATALTDELVPEVAAEHRRKFSSGQVPRQPHMASNSS
jgi:hypothetical protein